MSLADRIRKRMGRDPVDAFGGDEIYDDDEAPSNLGRRIALGLSAFLFLAIVGLGGFVYWAGKDAPPPQNNTISLTDLKVEETDAPAAPPTAPAPPSAAVPAAPTQSAVNDRSSDRRPWLKGAPPAATPPTAKPPATVPPAAVPPVAAVAPPPPPAQPKAQAAVTPPPPTAPMPPVSKVPAPGTVAAAPVPPPKDAHAPAAAPAPSAAMPSILAKTPQAAPAEQQAADESPVDVAPGAPDRYIEKADSGETGRPRLLEPALPPIDKASTSAAPPRFGNLNVVKVKATPPAPDKGAKTGKVAVIVQGLGLNNEATEAAVTKLPAAVTLSFSPYARDLRKWLAKAKSNGHEVLVEVPMESKQFPAEDPGPMGLMTNLQPKENAERLSTMLKLFPDAIGIDDIVGSKFREEKAHMNDVFKTLQEKKLVYIQGRPGVRIGEPGVPNTIADLIIDERPFRAAIDARLDYAERLAKYQGSAVTVMGTKPVSYERLALWLEQIDKRGIELTPVSKVLVQPGRAPT
jgi:polysaccharide deacetylase 2 family uncharacterized protein YibQ